MLRVYCRARAGVLPLHSLTRSLTRSLTQNITSNVLLSPPLTQTPNPSPVPHFNTSVMAHLAQGSIFCSHGNTAVHVAVCSKLPTSATSAGDSFLPLTVDYKNKFSSLGKIPMNTNRRERHGTDDEILASRVIDRSIRPLFPKSFRNDTQITTTSHAVDGVSDPIVLGVNAASCALLQAGLPWHGPVGCVRVGCIDGKLVANPSIADMASSTLDLLYTGTEYRTIMVEATGSETPEPEMVAALRFAHEQIKPIIEAQWETLAKSSNLNNVSQRRSSQFSDVWPNQLLENSPQDLRISQMQQFAMEFGLEKARIAFASSNPDKSARGLIEHEARSGIKATVVEEFPDISPNICDAAVSSVMAKAFRDNMLAGGDKVGSVAALRPDGRGLTDVRPITSHHDVLPTVHGSSFFQRGDTHVLATVTLGPRDDARVTECLLGRGELTHHFFLHYDFPPYCTGEIGNATAVNRRMIGHGNLAEKAVRQVMPSVSEFPYTVRVSAECTSSSGSSSMASACAASLALMDAGVPLKAAVAGISVGLVVKPSLACVNTEDSDKAATVSKNWELLTDILGTEDYYGDMDCKVAGSTSGITAIQLDIKLQHGIPLLALEQALYKAKDGREIILKSMHDNIKAPRKNIKPTAPLAVEIKFDPERKRHLIGPGGEMVRYIETTYDVTVDTSEEGFAYIHGKSHRQVSEAELLVQDLVLDPQEGDNYLAEVIEIKDFGCLVRLTRAQDALLHISEMTTSEKLRRKGASELVALGQRLRVQVIGVDREYGTVKVSRKALIQKAGNTEEDDLKPEVPSAEDRLMAIGTLPTFPVIPPRKWSPDFFLHNVATKDDIAQAMEKQSSVSVIADLQSPRGKDVDDSSKRTSSSVKLEHMVLTVEDLEELGSDKLKAELRARGEDFRGEDVKEMAARLFRVVTAKQKLLRKGNFSKGNKRK